MEVSYSRKIPRKTNLVKDNFERPFKIHQIERRPPFCIMARIKLKSQKVLPQRKNTKEADITLNLVTWIATKSMKLEEMNFLTLEFPMMLPRPQTLKDSINIENDFYSFACWRSLFSRPTNLSTSSSSLNLKKQRNCSFTLIISKLLSYQ